MSIYIYIFQRVSEVPIDFNSRSRLVAVLLLYGSPSNTRPYTYFPHFKYTKRVVSTFVFLPSLSWQLVLFHSLF